MGDVGVTMMYFQLIISLLILAALVVNMWLHKQNLKHTTTLHRYTDERFKLIEEQQRLIKMAIGLGVKQEE